mmetsp:Transcript_31452/g.74188  ORF Transcript_31452/g.74188 Transcript_31452/m.74188 type:complete len:225 (+) Transcript_31452:52-726(+)
MYSTPINALGRATGVVLKKDSSKPGSCPWALSCTSRSWRIRLALVPMSVHVPPSSAANDRGMRKREVSRPLAAAHLVTMGSIMATTGVLLMKEEHSTTGTQSCKVERKELRYLPRKTLTASSIVPASSKHLATTNKTPMASSPSDRNPLHAWSSVMMLNTRRIRLMPSSTTSGGLSLIMHTKPPQTRAMTNQLCHVRSSTASLSAASKQKLQTTKMQKIGHLLR